MASTAWKAHFPNSYLRTLFSCIQDAFHYVSWPLISMLPVKRVLSFTSSRRCFNPTLPPYIRIFLIFLLWSLVFKQTSFACWALQSSRLLYLCGLSSSRSYFQCRILLCVLLDETGNLISSDLQLADSKRRQLLNAVGVALQEPMFDCQNGVFIVAAFAGIATGAAHEIAINCSSIPSAAISMPLLSLPDTATLVDAAFQGFLYASIHVSIINSVIPDLLPWRRSLRLSNLLISCQGHPRSIEKVCSSITGSYQCIFLVFLCVECAFSILLLNFAFSSYSFFFVIHSSEFMREESSVH